MEKKFGEQYASIQDLVKDLVSGQTLTMFEVADHSEVLSRVRGPRTSFFLFLFLIPRSVTSEVVERFEPASREVLVGHNL